MGLLRHILIKRLLLGLILMTGIMHAQDPKLERANMLWRAKQFDQAMQCIDSVIQHPQTRSDFLSWTTRAYIYNDIFRRNDRLKLHSALRDTVIASLKMSNSLNPDTVFINNNRRMYRTISYGYYNLAKSLLHDSLNYERSAFAYSKFKELYSFFDPEEKFAGRDVEYNLAVGSVYSDIFIKDNNNTRAAEIAKVALMKVTEIQPDQPSALINMGLMYYNQAANMSRSLDGGEDLSQIDIVQDNMVKLAKQAEQLIIRVYNNDPTNTRAMRALYYIYRMLYDIERSNEFKNKLKESGIDVEKEDKESEQKDKQENKDK